MDIGPEEMAYYKLSGEGQRRVVRAALKRWRELHPELLPATSVHDGYYGWVLRSTAEESRIVARVMEDCIVPYLRDANLEV